QDTLLGVLITAASEAIEKYCRRPFYSRTLDELYNGEGQVRLMLREYPVQSVKSVRFSPQTVLQVQNTDRSTNQQARVQVTSTGLTLTRVASGVTSSSTVNFAGNATIDTLVTAIVALGNGWTAIRSGDATDYGKWPSADLYVPPSFGDGTQS